MAPATFLAFMVGTNTVNPDADKEMDIWHDVEVLRFLQTQQYSQEMSAQSKTEFTVGPRRTAGWQIASSKSW